MISRGRGSVVAVASVAGLAGLPFLDAYVASKHGIIGLVKALAIELADRNIRVNAVCPTGVAGTGMQLGLREDILATAGEKLRFPFKNAFKNDLIEKSDVSAAVLYLASDAARSVTGTTLTVDAGLLAL
ncbi:SDR family oxidoreductase [Rhizobium leguminosarum]|uniref:SDR family oxidoreductase n=1 Tax=Rhizobium leguminosarum TaxID=384 RepID=UPI00247AD1F4|nr:SDR family oxidoreductase [Rhizobium leguminosarum]